MSVITEVYASESDERWNSLEIQYLLDDLFDALAAYAPEGYYFGSHLGDGSDFGYWPLEYDGV